MTDLGTLIGRYVRPAVKAAGFGESAAGFHLEAGNGDRVILAFQPYEFDEGESFEVFFVTVPRSYWDWVTRDAPGSGEPDAGGAVARCDIAPPPGLGFVFDDESDDDDDDGDGWEDDGVGDPYAHHWALSDDDDLRQCGPALARLLQERYIPLMRRLLDREAQSAAVLDPNTEVGPLKARDLVTAFLRVDDAGPAELESLLSAIAPDTPNRAALTGWLRDRGSRA
ncbi:hypothetical protein ABZ901_02655 [Actinacidiphila alni]|uniref:hypothetical protein n=1 Tax=Actinacidiphila alni TaxID=380248 RepID=UPI00340AE96F